MKKPLLLGVVGLVIVGACSSGEGSDVRSFDEIAVSPPSVEVDASGTFATLTVITSIDAVCAVAYGPDESMGSLATDQDMGGAGHDHHTAVMTGLTPGTEYTYRLQGVGPDGVLYQSEILTFTTPAGHGQDGLGPNIALGATIVDVSSEFSRSFGAERAVDGDVSTEWSSSGDGDDAYIVIDLGETFEAAGVGFRTRTMTDGSSITTSFAVTVDENETLGPFSAGPGLAVVREEFSGQIIRFDVHESTGGNTGAIEIEVYSTP